MPIKSKDLFGTNKDGSINDDYCKYCYENGDGVEKSRGEAIKWYKLAAQQGHEIAQQNLRRLGVTEW